MKHAILLASLLACACGGSSPRATHPVQARAPFDLHCTAEQMRYMILDDKTIAAQGCQRRATYVKVCRRTGMVGTMWQHDECQWVVDMASHD